MKARSVLACVLAACALLAGCESGTAWHAGHQPAVPDRTQLPDQQAHPADGGAAITGHHDRARAWR